jgi:hypothetical protein
LLVFEGKPWRIWQWSFTSFMLRTLSWRKNRNRVRGSIDDGSCCAETVLGERLQVLQQNVVSQTDRED